MTSAWRRGPAQRRQWRDPLLYPLSYRGSPSELRAWLALDQPLIVRYSNGIEAPHPLLRVIREAELDAAHFGPTVGIDGKVRGRPGRKPEAVVGSKIGTSPVARLRAAKR